MLLATLLLGCSEGFFGKDEDPAAEPDEETDADTDTDSDTDADADSDTDTDTDADADADTDADADADTDPPDPEDVDDDRDGLSENEGDCDDGDAAVSPDAQEEAYNGADDDCDPATRDDDLDGDGFDLADDCDDEDAASNPDAPEDTKNGADDDCDGAVDERFDVVEADASCDCGYPSAITVDSAGGVHVVYLDGDAGGIRAVSGDGATWDTPVDAVPEAGAGEWLDAAMDDADELQIAFTYTLGGETALHWAYRDAGGTWSSAWIVDDESVSGSTDVGYYVSLALDDGNRPSFAYFDNEAGEPILADLTSLGYLVVSQIDYNWTGPTGYYTSLALDSDGWDYVAYYDDGFSAQEVQLGVPLEGTVSEVIDDEPGNDVSLAMRSDDVPCVAYQATASADLKYGCREGDWALETVDSVGNVGAGATLAFDGDDDPWIAYYDATNGDLKVATREDGAWDVRTVDSTGDVGLAPSIAIDAWDAVYVSYYDATRGTLKVAAGN
jgi:hypothetical protein